MTEEEKATAPTAEKGPKDCKTCHSAGHIGPVCADCIELSYRHYTPDEPKDGNALADMLEASKQDFSFKGGSGKEGS